MHANSKASDTGNPDFITSLAFVRNACQFIHENYHRGDFYRLNLPFNTIYVATSPDVLHHVFIKNEKNYIKSKIYWQQLQAIVGNALGTLEGKEWVRLKQLQKPFFSHKAITHYLPKVIACTQRHFDRWSRQQEIDIISGFSEMNIEILLSLLFGIEENIELAEVARFIAHGEETIAWRSKYPWRPYTGWINGRNRASRKYLDYFQALTEKAIQGRKKTGTETNLLDGLIAESSRNEKMGVEEIRNEIIIHLGAGTETAAVSMGWTLYLLGRHPEYLQQVEKEIEQVTGGQPIHESHYPYLLFTRKVIKESLRLYPSSHALVRDAVAPDQIRGIQIKRGDTIFMSTYGLHHNPRYWEQADAFIPERFEQEEQFDKHAYAPFGAGRHNCIGRHLGLPMMVLAIASFIQQFRYKLCAEKEIGSVSLSTLKPEIPINIQLQKKYTHKPLQL